MGTGKDDTFCEFLWWYNNKDVFPNLDAKQKMIEFYQNRGIDILNQTTCGNQTLVLMLINYILILCVRIIPQACLRDGTKMKKHKVSRLDKIDFERLKIWSSHTFKQPDLNAKLRATLLQEHRKKTIALVLMFAASLEKLSLKHWVVIFVFVLVKKLDRT